MNSAKTSCPQLPFTGLDFPLAIVVAAILCVAVGVAVVVGTRRGHPRAPVVLMVVLAGFAIAGFVRPASAGAATPGCSRAATPAFSIAQVSTIDGLAPGAPAVEIELVGTNTGNATLVVRKVVARITSVSKAPLAAAGRCDATDYVILGALMPVNETVPPDETVEITGATIGFSDRPHNQDACKGAMVHLSYAAYGG